MRAFLAGVALGTSVAAAHGQCVQWVNRSPVPNSQGDLGGSSDVALVYDSTRQKIYAISGSNRFGFPSTLTCQWLPGTGWSTVSNTTPGRYQHGAVYDGTRDRVILHGGYQLNPTFAAKNDTWAMNPATGVWTQLNPATSPPALVWPSLAYDSSRDVIVLFGGINYATQVFSNETWEFNGTNWVRRFPASAPDPRMAALMAYDSDRHVVVLYGGTTNTTLGSPPSRSDTWEYNGTNWTQMFPVGFPQNRSGHTMTYDSVTHRVILHSGSSDSLATDTWAYTPGTWTFIGSGGPVGGNSYFMAFDASRGVNLVIGGNPGSNVFETVPATAPTISAHPQSRTVRAGFPVTFTVATGGATPQSYQWKKDGNSISGATASSYSIAECVPSNQGQYSVTVLNFCGSITSQSATLTVRTLPQCDGDFNNDGSLDFFDYLDFVDAFSAGCP